MKKYVTLNTINVIERTASGELTIHSFDSKDKAQEAESLFEDILREMGVTKKDLNSYVEDGYYQDGDYELYLVHGNVSSK